jgi:predicted GH43/DUF377 family glycosyl hydrolase
MLVFFLVGCGTSQATPTPLPEPTQAPPELIEAPPEPTEVPPEPTATQVVPTATELPPQPTPTNTTQPTPTLVPTETQIPIRIDFTPYENNPILTRGASGEWDYYRVWAGNVVYIDEAYHMFYTGKSEDTIGIGYAVSTDGLDFTKHDANPIFQPDGEGFDAIGVGYAVPLVVGDTWMLYYNASAEGEVVGQYMGGGSNIGLTTAPGPIGPWAQGEHVLRAGERGEWDAGFVVPSSVIATEDGYVMYYSGGPEQVFDASYPLWMCGMATSPDGINWTKYDDPDTTEAPYSKSDPVMKPSDSGFDSAGVHCSVLKTDSGWEMLYEGWSGPSKIGYATSSDGINWSKYQDKPILGNYFGFPDAMKVGLTYYLYYYYYAEDDQRVTIGTITQP